MKLNNFLNKTSVVQIAILLVLTMVIFLPIKLTAIAFHDITDYPTYIDNAKDISANPVFWKHVASNPGWMMQLLAVKEVFRFSHWKAALLVQLANQGLLALGLFLLTCRVISKNNRWLPIALPLAIMIAAPVFLLALKDGRLYFGYLGINSYHNPTTFALKPYAMLLFYITSLAFLSRKMSTFQNLLCLMSLAASTLIKPNFTISLLPAAGIIFIINLLRKKKFAWKSLLFLVFLPALLILGAEYLLTFTSSEVGVIFAPFVVMRNSSNFLLLKFILSIWFPILVLILFWKDAKNHFPLMMAWLTFFFGAAYTYFLAEGGWRIFHGNFTWSGEITSFILFVVSSLFFFQRIQLNQPDKKWGYTAILGFMPHIVCGVIYYIYCLTNNTYF